MVQATAITMRNWLGPAWVMGSGTKTNAPSIRTSTMRNAKTMAPGTVSSLCIVVKIAEQRDRVAGHAVQHPRQQQQKTEQERGQPGHGAEHRILHGRCDLDQVDDDAHGEG